MAPAGTVARGWLREDEALHTGKLDGLPVEAIPFAVAHADIRRGQERFTIYCTPCHGQLGDGNGMVVQRGLRQAANFHQDRLRQERIGYFFDVITNGFGAMQGYAEQVPVRDRWLIAAYVRALQYSQNASVPTCQDAAASLARARSDAAGGTARRSGSDSQAAAEGTRQSVATETYQPPETVGGLQRVGTVAASSASCVTIVGFVLSGQERFFQAYLVAYTFVFGIVLGSMALLMVHHLSGGAWGLVIRRPLEAAVRTCRSWRSCTCRSRFGIHDLYHWSHPEAAATDPILQ